MQQRRLLFLPEFNCKILHLSGSENVVADVLRPLLPELFWRKVIDNIHKISHLGKRASRRLVSRIFEWEFLSKDVNLWSKIQVHVKAPILQIPISHIHLDLIGPLFIYNNQ